MRAAALFERWKLLELKKNNTLIIRQPGLTITKSQMNQSNHFNVLVQSHFYGEIANKSSQQQVNLDQFCLSLGSTCFLFLSLSGYTTLLLHSSSISCNYPSFERDRICHRRAYHPHWISLHHNQVLDLFLLEWSRKPEISCKSYLASSYLGATDLMSCRRILLGAYSVAYY